MKNRRTLAIGLPIGSPGRAWLSEEKALLQRVRLVLGTPPGSLPWRPEFGCALWHLMGQPATFQRLSEARWAVEEALSRWIPEAKLLSCEARVVEGRFPEPSGAYLRREPLEGALLHLGHDGVLQLELVLSTRNGPVRAQLDLAGSEV